MAIHPITPPQQMIEQWSGCATDFSDEHWAYERDMTIAAARWGADQELAACCYLLWLQQGMDVVNDLCAARRPKPELAACCYLPWLQQGMDVVDDLRSARRPKPPSLKKLALEAIGRLDGEKWCAEMEHDLAVIHRALEQLDD